MKKLALGLALISLALSAFAQEKGTRAIALVENLKDIQVEVEEVEDPFEKKVGRVYRFSAKLEFSNACVADVTDLFLHNKDVILPSGRYYEYHIEVFSLADDLCTADFDPVTRSVDLGSAVEKIDGRLAAIVINGQVVYRAAGVK